MTEDQSQGNPHNMPDRIPGAPMPPHPKESLYAHAYDPVVAEWFLNLQSSEALGEFLESAPSRELSQNLQGLIPVFDRRSDEVMATMEAAHRGVMDTIHLHRDNVIWGKDEVLPESPSREDVGELFRQKLRRNVGQAYIEAVLCLESARKYLDGMNIRGNEARTILAQSQWLISTLAAMHDEQEIMTIQQLLDGAAFDYPAVTIDDIIAGKFAIPPDHLDLTEVHGVKRVGFKDLPKVQSKFETPKEMCPAHRIKDADGARLNDTFWKLLVDVYALSGEFEEGKPEAN